MKSWTDADFDKLSWHDNHVHGLRVEAGEYGAGDLFLDLDYIEQWLPAEGGRCRFSIVPSTLHFKDVTSLKVELDWASPTAALTPFSLDRIERSPNEYGTGYRWELVINWPVGRISFESTGFTQHPTAGAVVSDEQVLSAKERATARESENDPQ